MKNENAAQPPPIVSIEFNGGNGPDGHIPFKK